MSRVKWDHLPGYMQGDFSPAATAIQLALSPVVTALVKQHPEADHYGQDAQSTIKRILLNCATPTMLIKDDQTIVIEQHYGKSFDVPLVRVTFSHTPGRRVAEVNTSQLAELLTGFMDQFPLEEELDPAHCLRLANIICRPQTTQRSARDERIKIRGDLSRDLPRQFSHPSKRYMTVNHYRNPEQSLIMDMDQITHHCKADPAAFLMTVIEKTQPEQFDVTRRESIATLHKRYQSVLKDYLKQPTEQLITELVRLTAYAKTLSHCPPTHTLASATDRHESLIYDMDLKQQRINAALGACRKTLQTQFMRIQTRYEKLATTGAPTALIQAALRRTLAELNACQRDINVFTDASNDHSRSITPSTGAIAVTRTPSPQGQAPGSTPSHTARLFKTPGDYVCRGRGIPPPPPTVAVCA